MKQQPANTLTQDLERPNNSAELLENEGSMNPQVLFQSFINSISSTEVYNKRGEKIGELDISEISKIDMGLPKYTSPMNKDDELVNFINGIPITEIENRTRSAKEYRDKKLGDYMHCSVSGFLATKESLKDVLVEDNRIVEEYKTTHGELAEILSFFVKIALESNKKALNGYPVLKIKSNEGMKEYIVVSSTKRLWQASPFADDETSWYKGRGKSGDFEISIFERVSANDSSQLTQKHPNYTRPWGPSEMEVKERCFFGGLNPFLIAAHGFYQGDVPHRIGPKEIIDLVPLVKSR